MSNGNPTRVELGRGREPGEPTSGGSEPGPPPAEPTVDVDTDRGPATITRADLIRDLTARMMDEGFPPFTSGILANVYATSHELDQMLSALDSAGGLPGLGGMVASMFTGKRKRKGSVDDG